MSHERIARLARVCGPGAAAGAARECCVVNARVAERDRVVGVVGGERRDERAQRRSAGGGRVGVVALEALEAARCAVWGSEKAAC